MAMFTTVSNHNEKLEQIDLPNSESTRVHLVGVKARVSTDITLKTSKEIKATINTSPFDGPKGIWIIDIRGLQNGSTLLEAEYKSSTVAKLKIRVFTKKLIVLPPINTEKGMLTRLFLSESINPGNDASYKEADSKKSMLWMRQVIENRLSHKNPSIFGATKKVGQSKYTITDIVRAKNQFHGFENYPTLSAEKNVNLNGFLSIANNYNHAKREAYAQFIKNANSAAEKYALKNFKDPCKTGLYGWRTKESSKPGGLLIKYEDLAGQTFYTLKK